MKPLILAVDDCTDDCHLISIVLGTIDYQCTMNDDCAKQLEQQNSQDLVITLIKNQSHYLRSRSNLLRIQSKLLKQRSEDARANSRLLRERR